LNPIRVHAEGVQFNGRWQRHRIDPERKGTLPACGRELVRAGRVTPIIDKTYPLSEVPDAFRYLAEGRARGGVSLFADFAGTTQLSDFLRPFIIVVRP